MRESFRRTGPAILLLVTVATVCVGQPQRAPAVTTSHGRHARQVKLATDVYLPGDGTGKYPVIVARTPYDKSKGGSGLAALAARRGYAFVIQDLRGRFQSEGHPAIIFGNDGLGEHQDGRDTLEWIARQPWCNGKIGSWGGSALGITQNMAAPVAPDELKAQHVERRLLRLLQPGRLPGRRVPHAAPRTLAAGQRPGREEPGDVRGPPALRRLLETAELRNAGRHRYGRRPCTPAAGTTSSSKAPSTPSRRSTTTAARGPGASAGS